MECLPCLPPPVCLSACRFSFCLNACCPFTEPLQRIPVEEGLSTTPLISPAVCVSSHTLWSSLLFTLLCFAWHLPPPLSLSLSTSLSLSLSTSLDLSHTHSFSLDLSRPQLTTLRRFLVFGGALRCFRCRPVARSTQSQALSSTSDETDANAEHNNQEQDAMQV